MVSPSTLGIFIAVCTTGILLIRYHSLTNHGDNAALNYGSIAIAFRLLTFEKKVLVIVQWRYEIKHVPNILTSLRILCSSLLLVAPVYTARFYLLYLICGVTDFLDGPLARKFHTASIAGASLDNIADYALLISTAIKVLPTLIVEVWALIWGICMLAAHISSSVIAWIKYKRIAVLHTFGNKLLGGVVYAIPLLAGLGNHTLLISIISSFMCFSVPEEIYLVLTSKQLEPDVRGVFFDNSNIHNGYSKIADAPNSITDE